jgi:hypothetical protein
MAKKNRYLKHGDTAKILETSHGKPANVTINLHRVGDRLGKLRSDIVDAWPQDLQTRPQSDEGRYC